MIKKEKFHLNIKALFNDFVHDKKSKKFYEVVGIEENKDQEKILIIQLEGRFIIKKTPLDIILDDTIVENLSPQAIRAITYLAVLEQLAPEMQLISCELDQKIKEYTVTLKNNKMIYEKISASRISKDRGLIKKLSSEDANRIGYMAGINDTVNEYTK